MSRPPFRLATSIVASAHVTAGVFLVIAYLSTRHWVPGCGAVAAGVCAWWLLRDDE
jgi:hypothetical protein